jgi:hypothetical protein
MAKSSSMKIIGNPSLNWSPLERLAHQFHQDFGFEGVDVQTAAARHISMLSSKERQLLKEELVGFLAKHPGKSSKGIRNAWGKMGAQSWPRDPPIREVLNNILGII